MDIFICNKFPLANKNKNLLEFIYILRGYEQFRILDGKV